MQKAIKIWFTLILMVIGNNLSQAQTIDTVCANGAERVYRVMPTPGSTYFWKIEGGRATTVQGLDSIGVQWAVSPGIYTIKVVERSKFGCLGDTVRAKVLVGRPVVTIDGKTDICKGQAVMLTANGARNYLWNTGATTQTIVADPHENTNYSVIGYTDICNPDTADFLVNVYDLPKADFSYSPKEPGVNEKVTFTYKGQNGKDWEWVIKNGTGFTKDNNKYVSEYTFTEGGDKEVTLVVKNKAGCIDSITYKFFIDDEAYIFVPTAFTPDGDNVNDFFKPVLTGVKTFELQIFNRWGERIKTLTGENDSWDATFRNERVQEGIYIYVLKAQGMNNRWYYLNGAIKVIY
ncbi:MAG: T9SS type B sorting domain-containing protein [Sphingobacteriaceae bacterium]|nr:MAG: T9SS type B sorting domain-containing protein [Sphingobacteriaceae bacterium]